MAKALYIGNGSNKATKAKKIYIGDSSNKARKVKKIYVGDSNNKARLCWSGINGNIVFTGPSDDIYYVKDLGAPQKITLPNATSVTECKVACSKNRFVIVVAPASSSSLPSVFYSNDGINWNQLSVMLSYANCYTNIKYFEETGYFVINNKDCIFYSTDGINWGYRDMGSYNITNVTYGNGMYILCLNNMYYATISGDIATGERGSIGTNTADGTVNLSCAAYGNGLFVSHQPNYGLYYYVPGDEKWTLASNLTKSIKNHDEISIIYANNMFLVSTKSNGMFYSYDGMSWHSYTPTYNIRGVSFDGEKFLGVGRNYYAHSTDGINWTYVAHNANADYSSIAGN